MHILTEPERREILDAEKAKWLTVEEVAYILDTSKITILKAIHEGHLKLFAVGNVWRIHRDSLPACQKAISEWRSDS